MEMNICCYANRVFLSSMHSLFELVSMLVHSRLTPLQRDHSQRQWVHLQGSHRGSNQNGTGHLHRDRPLISELKLFKSTLISWVERCFNFCFLV